MTSEKVKTRRRYDEAMKAQVMAECDAPGASVAQVAMSRGINANVVHRWRQLAREGRPPVPARTGAFVPVPLPAPAPTPHASDIRIELRRAMTTMTITWPVSAACDFAAWTRELLR